MKFIIFNLLLWWALPLFAQTEINQTISLNGAKKINLDFKYPDLKISSWDKNEILIKGIVNINNGQNDKAFKIDHSVDGDILRIMSIIENIDELPKRIQIKRDGVIYFFNTDNFNDPKVQQFINEEGGDYQYSTMGVIKEIQLEIMVPAGVAIDVDAKYGEVELTDFNSPMVINAKYGEIDISFPGSSKKNLHARTKYGEIYTNLDTDFNESVPATKSYDKWTIVSTKLNGGGLLCELESKYGNVYMRKGN